MNFLKTFIGVFTIFFSSYGNAAGIVGYTEDGDCTLLIHAGCGNEPDDKIRLANIAASFVPVMADPTLNFKPTVASIRSGIADYDCAHPNLRSNVGSILVITRSKSEPGYCLSYYTRKEKEGLVPLPFPKDIAEQANRFKPEEPIGLFVENGALCSPIAHSGIAASLKGVNGQPLIVCKQTK